MSRHSQAAAHLGIFTLRASISVEVGRFGSASGNTVRSTCGWAEAAAAQAAARTEVMA